MISKSEDKASAERGTRGVDCYPFDPLLRPESVDGLDRLRCIPDRQYAAMLYKLYELAERNEAEYRRKQEHLLRAAEKRERARQRLRELARRALAGAFGVEAQELARCVVVDAVDNLRNDDRTLAEFGRVLTELGVL